MSIYLVTSLVTFYALCITAIAWAAINSARNQARDSTQKAIEAMRSYMAECVEFDRAVPERCAAWPDERSEVGMRSHRDDLWAAGGY